MLTLCRFLCRWMALQQYSDVDCEGEVTLVSGVPLGVCLIEYDDNGRAVGSVEYNCNSGTHAS